MFVLIDIALMIQYPHLDADQFIGLYFIGGIGALSFFAGGYFEDMKLHYIKIDPEAKIFCERQEKTDPLAHKILIH